MNIRLSLFLFIAALHLCLTTTLVSAYNVRVMDELVEFVLEKWQGARNDTSTTTTSSTPSTQSSKSSSSPTSSPRAPPTSDDTKTSAPTSHQNSPTSTQTTETPDSGKSTSSLETTQTSSSTTQPSLTTRITTITREVSIHTVADGTSVSLSTEYTNEVQTVVETLTSGSSSKGNSTGISTSTRNTIIGVVVGVGGAIVIGALLIVAFRLRRRKSAGVAATDDARPSPTSTHPIRPQQDAFKENLDQYHKPHGTVNPSANF